MKKKWSYYHAGYSFLVTHPGTNPAKQGSTWLSGRHVVLSLWYSDSERNCLYWIPKMRKGNKEREKFTDIGWENKEQKKSWEEWKWELLLALRLALRLQNSPALCDVVLSISQLFVPHFAMSAFAFISNKQPDPSFEFFAILLTFGRLKQ